MRPPSSPRTSLHARLAIGSALAATLLAAGCGGSDPVAPPPQPVEIGTVSPATGGTLASPGGTAQLVFPPGAVATATPITAQPATPPAGDATVVPGTVFDFGPDGAQFAQPVQLTIAYDPARLPAGTAEGTLAIHKLFPDGWRLVPGGTVDVATRKVSAPISTFSVYAVRPVSVREATDHVGNAQQGIAGAATSVAPAVRVYAPGGQPLVGVAVTFAVASGGGSVDGASAVTDADGVATVGAWVLGAEPGANTMTATVASGPTVTFDATGVAACEFAPAYALGTTATGALGATDCAESTGRRADYRTLVVGSETSVTVTMAAQGFTPLVGITTADGTPLVTQYAGSPGFTRAVLAAGSYRLTTRAVETTGAGTYTVTVAAAPNDANACEVSARVFLTVGSGNDGRLAETDCVDEVGDPQDRVDSYSVWLTAGTTYRATLTGAPRAKLSVFGPSAATPGPMELAGGPASATVLFTATESGWHALYPLGRPGGTYRVGISTAQAIPACDQAPSYTIGDRVEGWLSAIDCAESTGRRVDYRTLTVDEESSLTLTMQGNGSYQPLVGITTPSGTPVATQYTASPGVTRVVLAAGTYRITTRGVELTAAGWYSLVVTKGALVDDACGVSTDVFLGGGAAVDGALTANDCADQVGDPNDRVDAHSVWMVAGRTYRATIAASPQAKLSLWAPIVGAGAFKDLASGPQTAEIVYTAKQDGWHPLYALGAVGTTYRIGVVEIPTVAVCEYVRPYVLGSSVLGKVGDDDCIGASDLPVDRYALTLPAQRSLTLTMGSGDLTPLVGVEDATGVAIATQYTTSPGFTRVILAPGTYRLTARPTAAAMRGVYAFTAAEATHADGCGAAFNVFMTPGATAAGAIGAADCADDFGDPSHKLDTYAVRMVAGTTYTMTLTTSADGWVSLWAPTETGTLAFVEYAPTTGAATVTLTYTAQRTGYHNVYAGGTPGLTYQLGVAGPPTASARRVRATTTSGGATPIVSPRRTASVRGPAQ